VRCLAATCTDGSEISRGRGNNGLRNDFNSRKDVRQRTFRGNPTQNRGKTPFIDSQDCLLSWDHKINLSSSPSICAGDEMKSNEMLSSPMDFTHVNSDSKGGQGIGCKTMLEILVSHAISTFLFLFPGDDSWLLHADMPITCKPCGYSVPKILTKFDVPHTSARRQWHLCSSIEQGCISLIFYFKCKRWTQSTLRSIEHIIPSLVSIYYPMGRSCRQSKCVVHFGNAPIHNPTHFPLLDNRSFPLDTQFKSNHWQISWTTPEKNAKLGT
jgi:hypothetical protein